MHLISQGHCWKWHHKLLEHTCYSIQSCITGHWRLELILSCATFISPNIASKAPLNLEAFWARLTLLNFTEHPFESWGFLGRVHIYHCKDLDFLGQLLDEAPLVLPSISGTDSFTSPIKPLWNGWVKHVFQYAFTIHKVCWCCQNSKKEGRLVRYP